MKIPDEGDFVALGHLISDQVQHLHCKMTLRLHVYEQITNCYENRLPFVCNPSIERMEGLDRKVEVNP